MSPSGEAKARRARRRAIAAAEALAQTRRYRSKEAAA